MQEIKRRKTEEKEEEKTEAPTTEETSHLQLKSLLLQAEKMISNTNTIISQTIDNTLAQTVRLNKLTTMLEKWTLECNAKACSPTTEAADTKMLCEMLSLCCIVLGNKIYGGK